MKAGKARRNRVLRESLRVEREINQSCSEDLADGRACHYSPYPVVDNDIRDAVYGTLYAKFIQEEWHLSFFDGQDGPTIGLEPRPDQIIRPSYGRDGLPVYEGR